MGTPNFARPSNASKYYVVLTNREEEILECPDCGHHHHEWEYENLNELEKCESCGEILEDVETESRTVYPDEWEYENLRDNLTEEIITLGGVGEDEWIGDTRSYGVRSFGSLSEYKSYGDVDLTVRLVAVMQGAYYEGATLDYLIYVDTYNDTLDYSTGSSYDSSMDEILEAAFDPYYTDMNAGLCEIMKPKAEVWIENTVEKLSEKLEALYQTYSEHKLRCKGVFSNGEAVYTEVD